MYIIDRTKNPKGKSIPNTERFLARVRSQIKTSIADLLKKAKIEEALGGRNNEIHVSGSILHEPGFHIDYGQSNWTKVLPGNPKEPSDLFSYNPPQKSNINPFLNSYVEEDIIYKPSSGSGSGNNGASSGNSIDDFIFSLGREEWEKYLWDELALPNQDETKSILTTPEWRKAGYASEGSPSNLALLRTAKNSFGRRIAFNRPTQEDLDKLMILVDQTSSEEELANLMVLIEEMKTRMSVIPWIDPIDVRYHSYKKEMKPKFNAVMFALMDVSGSMTEEMKDLAKRFYILLYSFLKARYERVEVIFIRHTHEAKEVDENTFFYDPESGGTVVSTALELMNNIIRDRFPLNDWNIYCAECSDGDNAYGDNVLVQNILEKNIFNIVQHFVYIEVKPDNSWRSGESDLWKCYTPYKTTHEKVFDMAKIKTKADVWPAMVKLYSKNREF